MYFNQERLAVREKNINLHVRISMRNVKSLLVIRPHHDVIYSRRVVQTYRLGIHPHWVLTLVVVVKR